MQGALPVRRRGRLLYAVRHGRAVHALPLQGDADLVLAHDSDPARPPYRTVGGEALLGEDPVEMRVPVAHPLAGGPC